MKLGKFVSAVGWLFEGVATNKQSEEERKFSYGYSWAREVNPRSDGETALFTSCAPYDYVVHAPSYLHSLTGSLGILSGAIEGQKV